MNSAVHFVEAGFCQGPLRRPLKETALNLPEPNTNLYDHCDPFS